MSSFALIRPSETSVFTLSAVFLDVILICVTNADVVWEFALKEFLVDGSVPESKPSIGSQSTPENALGWRKVLRRRQPTQAQPSPRTKPQSVSTEITVLQFLDFHSHDGLDFGFQFLRLGGGIRFHFETKPWHEYASGKRCDCCFYHVHNFSFTRDSRSSTNHLLQCSLLVWSAVRRTLLLLPNQPCWTSRSTR